MDVQVGFLITPGVFLGGLLGGKLAAQLSPQRMRVVFAALLFLIGTWQLAPVWIP